MTVQECHFHFSLLVAEFKDLPPKEINASQKGNCCRATGHSSRLHHFATKATSNLFFEA
jgi:hypothetical protein